MSSSDKMVEFLNRRFGNVWRALVEVRGTGTLTCFGTATLKQELLAARGEAIVARNQELEHLRQSKASVVAAHAKFQDALPEITDELLELQNQSTDLAATSVKLSQKFTQIANRLGTGAASVERARQVKEYLEDVTRLGRAKDLAETKRHIMKCGGGKETEIPPEATAEYVAKLKKIIETADERTIRDAKANLEAYRGWLFGFLMSEFTAYGASTEDQKAAMHALDILGENEKVVDIFLSSTNVLGEDGNQYRYVVDDFDEDDKRIAQRLKEPDENGVVPELDHTRVKKKIRDKMERYRTCCTYIEKETSTLWRRIESIFENPHYVKQCFLQRVFVAAKVNIISDHIENILSYVKVCRKSEYCDYLNSLYERTRDLTNDITKNGGGADCTEFMERIFGETQNEYGPIEIDQLRENMDALIEVKVAQVHKKDKSSIFKKEADVNPFEIFDQLVGFNVLELADQAWKRCSHLSIATEMSNNLGAILDMTLEKVFKGYLNVFMDAAGKLIKRKKDADLMGKFLTFVTQCHAVVSDLEARYANSLKTIFVLYPDVNRAFTHNKNEAFAELEEKVVKGLKVCIELAKKRVSDLLSSKQKKGDYDLSELPFDFTKYTDACREFRPCVSDMVREINSLSSDNCECFMTVFGQELFSVLTTHLLKFRYTEFGMNKLLVDVNGYKEVIDLLHVESLSLRFDDLVKVTSIMQLPPVAIKEAARQALPFNDPTMADYARKLLSARRDIKEFGVDGLFDDAEPPE